MRHNRIYQIVSSIEIDGKVMRGYYTVFNNWVFNEENTDIEYFSSIEAAEERYEKILKIPSNKIRRYMIINDKGFIVRQDPRKEIL